jgi:hypothetical protein
MTPRPHLAKIDKKFRESAPASSTTHDHSKIIKSAAEPRFKRIRAELTHQGASDTETVGVAVFPV